MTDGTTTHGTTDSGTTDTGRAEGARTADGAPFHGARPDGRLLAAVAAVVFAATLVALNAGRGRVELSLGDLILSAATGAVVAGLVVVGLTVRDELARPRRR